MNEEWDATMSSSSKPREIYLPIHALSSCSERSECPYFEVIEYGREPEVVCIAYCKVTERYLTRSAVKKCIAYWSTCPFKQYADHQLTSQ
ncbi:MAG: hypothetical protein ACO2OR_02650 [Desulfurococcaceae archaeon]